MLEETRHTDLESWLKRVEALLNYTHGLTVFDIEDKIDLESLYFDDKRPQEVVAIIADKFL